ncbi:hypothetical protein D3C85_1216660 [compost metagenome]
MQLSCPDAELVLDEERQNIEATQARFVAKHDEQPHADQGAADEGRVDGLYLANLQHPIKVVRHEGDDRDRGEGIEGETRPHPEPGQGVERQVHAEEQQAEAQARHLLQQQRQPGGAAGEQPDLMKQEDAE